MARGKKRRPSQKKRKGKKESAMKGFNIGRAKIDTFDFIDDMWAEHGVVRVRTKEGVTSTLTTTMAALRCKAINEMELPPWLQNKRNKFLEKAIDVIRQAKHQQENKGSDIATEGIQNVLSGLTVEGKEMPETKDEDELVQKFAFQFPALHQDDIRAILREPNLEPAQKEFLMGEVHKQNVAKMEFKLSQEP
jgi:hypothetical protein